MTYQLHHGDCINIMPLIERESVDAIVTDPPYGLGFMGKDWDHGVPGMHFWLEALRCAKPGAYLLAFGGTRTFHRLAVAIEDAGWEIRDTVMWVYGQGFPKSHNVALGIDKQNGAIGDRGKAFRTAGAGDRSDIVDANGKAGMSYSNPITESAAEWDGWGTALKPAWEPIIVARKPLQGTVAENVQRYGTGAMNIDACRIEIDDVERDTVNNRSGRGWGTNQGAFLGRDEGRFTSHTQGRWPANLIHDGSAEVLAGFPVTSSGGGDKRGINNGSIWGHQDNRTDPTNHISNTGIAARFFYCAKASKADRDEGCEDVPLHDPIHGKDNDSGGLSVSNACIPSRNHHPTVKPTALMRYLCRLVTPPNGTILDPFMGSGSTGKAAMLEGFNFIGIDTEIEYVEIAARRIEHACEKVGIVIEQPMMFETRRETVDKPKQMILL